MYRAYLPGKRGIGALLHTLAPGVPPERRTAPAESSGVCGNLLDRSVKVDAYAKARFAGILVGECEDERGGFPECCPPRPHR